MAFGASLRGPWSLEIPSGRGALHLPFRITIAKIRHPKKAMIRCYTFCDDVVRYCAIKYLNA